MIIKDKSWYIHDFFEPVNNNAIAYYPSNAAVIAYFDILTFSLITALATKKFTLETRQLPPKKYRKYCRLLSSGKRAIKQNIMNLKRLKILL